MAGAIYKVVSGSTMDSLQNSMATHSLDGYSTFGGISVSGSVFVVLMGKGTGNIGLTTAEQINFTPIVFPPQTGDVNLNPNVISQRT